MADASTVRGLVAELDPTIAVAGLQGFDGLRAQRLAYPRFRALLFGWFAVLAVILGAVGVYGVVGYAIEQRAQELRIRRALGADRVGILTHVIIGGMRPVVIGIVVGLLAASQASRLLESFLFGVSALDPPTYAAAALLLMIVGVAACLIPGARAAAADPAGALRSD